MQAAKFFSVFIALIGGSIWLSRVLDRRWRAKYRKEKPFAWGYFQAIGMIIAGSSWLVGWFDGTVPSALAPVCVVFFVGGLAIGLPVIIKKKKWAWLLMVILQLDPIIWIIDYIYGKNRWKEFR
jgi:hypothetical protein